MTDGKPTMLEQLYDAAQGMINASRGASTLDLDEAMARARPVVNGIRSGELEAVMVWIAADRDTGEMYVALGDDVSDANETFDDLGCGSREITRATFYFHKPHPAPIYEGHSEETP